MLVSDMKTLLQHPQAPNSKIYVIFNVCHLIKLMRNLLGDYKVICHQDRSGQRHAIRWQYIENLNNLQEDMGFSFANKLKKKHILWTKHKMNISLAAQTLSGSVANAISFLRDEVTMSEFEGSEATTEFINRMNLVFDLLNSRNPHAEGAKAPVSLKNLEIWLDSWNNIAEYIFALKDERGNYLQTGHRKTAIWCFTFSIRSIQSIVTELLKRSCRPYKHALTYKLSQDNIELLFNKIRRHSGWNNNPNVLQFKYAL